MVAFALVKAASEGRSSVLRESLALFGCPPWGGCVSLSNLTCLGFDLLYDMFKSALQFHCQRFAKSFMMENFLSVKTKSRRIVVCPVPL